MLIKNTTHRNVCQQCIVPLYEASWLVFERATSLKLFCLHSPLLDVHEMWNDLWSLLFCQVHEVNITAYDLVLQARSPVKNGVWWASCL